MLLAVLQVGGTNIATVPRCQCDLVAAARIASKEVSWSTRLLMSFLFDAFSFL